MGSAPAFASVRRGEECGKPVWGAGFMASGFMVGCENNFGVLLGARECLYVLMPCVPESKTRVRVHSSRASVPPRRDGEDQQHRHFP